jgi:hypothetical protein
MTVYGQYQSVEEIARGPFHGVLSARREGETTASCVVKVCEPPVVVSEKRAAELLEQFEGRVAVQRSVAVEGSGWAPVLDAGRHEDGAYYVTHRYESSVDQLVEGRVRLEEPVLASIVDGVVRGLERLRDAASRRHGNLKPSNVLLSGLGGGGTPTVALTDPRAPGEVAEGDERDGDDATSDVRAVGEIIYALVMHRAFPGVRAWPVKSGPEWAKPLGSNGSWWCSLCNALLAPPQSAEITDLRQLRERLAARPALKRPGKRRTLLYTSAVALIAIGGGAAYVFWPTPEPECPWDAERLVSWIEQYDPQDGWFRRLVVTYRNSEHQRFTADPQLASVFDLVAAAAADPLYDTNGLLGEKNTQLIGDLEDRVSRYEDEQDTTALGRLACRVENAHARIDAVRAAIEQWDAPEQLRSRAEAFGARGWDGAAARLRELSEGLLPWGDGGAESLRRWELVVRLGESATLAGIDDRLEAITALVGELAPEVAEEALLSGLEPDASADDPFTALDESLRQLQSNLETVAEADRDVRAMLEEEDKITALEVHPDGPSVRQRHDEVRTGLVTLLGASRPAAALGEELTTANEELREIGASIVSIENQIAAGSGDPRRKVDALAAAVDNAASLFESPALQGAYRSAAERENSAGRALLEEQRDRLESLRVRLDTNEALNERLGRLDALLECLEAVDGQHREPLLGGGAADAPIDGAVVERVRTERREASLASLVTTLDGRDCGAIDLDEAWSGYLQWVDAGRDLVDRLRAAARALDAGYGLEDATPDGPSPAEIDRQLSANAAYDDLRPALDAWSERLAALRDVSGQTDASVLATRADAGAPEIALAAWRTASALEPPPEDEEFTASVEAEGRVISSARGAVTGLAAADAARRAELEQTLGAAGRTRWTELAQAAGSERQLRAVLAVREPFAADDSLVETLPTLRWNLAVLTLRDDLEASAADEAACQGHLEQFVASAGDLLAALPAAERSRGEAVRQSIATLLAEKDRNIFESDKEGPSSGRSSVRWTFQEPRSTDRTLVYTWAGPRTGRTHELVFHRVGEGGGEGRTTYLLADETSLGLFADLLAAAGSPAEALGELASKDNEASGWTIDGQQIEPTRSWMPIWPGRQFRRDLQEKADASPSWDHPVQRVSPPLAMYVARLVDCRLPTEQEWIEARRTLAADDGLPNLRRKWFRTAHRELDMARQLGGLGAQRLAWADTNVFVPDGTDVQSGPRAQVVDDGDDGALWFQPTAPSSSAGLRNLEGNVHELVLRSEPATMPAAGATVGAFRSSEWAYAVIGGSALSPPEVDWTRAWQVPADRSCADVGFRLALSVEGSVISLAREGKALLADPPYVFAAR